MALQNIDTCQAGTSPYSASLHTNKCKPGARVEFGVDHARPRSSLALQGVAKLTFMTGIAAGILFAWQGIALHVQQFSVRQDAVTPVAATVARWMHNAWTAALQRPVNPVPQSTFAAELRMNATQLMNRWSPMIAAASARFDVPAVWIRAVVQMESGGRTMSSADRPITSHAGAMGVMQLMPGTYQQMRAQYRLGANPYNPQDNISAGAAYLHWLYRKYGYPAMFAAYNDGPGHLDDRLTRGKLLPAETRNYISRIVTELGGAPIVPASNQARFTRPNGTPVTVDLAQIRSVRVALPGEYAPGVNTVISIGQVRQAVRESFDDVKSAMLAQGALGQSVKSNGMQLSELLSQGQTTPRHAAHATTDRRAARARVVTLGHRDRHPRRLAEADTGGIHLHPISRHLHSRA